MSDKTETGPAIVDGVVRYTSVSQIQSFDVGTVGGCPRKWFFDKKLHVPRPESKSLEIGHRCHAEVEHYLLTGEDVLSMLMRQGKYLLPDRRHIDRLMIEHPLSPEVERSGKVINLAVEFADLYRSHPQGEELAQAKFGTSTLWAAPLVPVVGKIDIVNPSGAWVDLEGVEQVDTEADIELIDHKTTSSIENWAKTPAELRKSIQMTGYGFYVAQHFGAKRVRLSHIYYQTRGRGAEKRTVVVGLDELTERWEATRSIVRAMQATARIEQVQDVVASFKSCSAFRGCEYRHLCPRSASEKLIEIFGKMPEFESKTGSGSTESKIETGSGSTESKIETSSGSDSVESNTGGNRSNKMALYDLFVANVTGAGTGAGAVAGAVAPQGLAPVVAAANLPYTPAQLQSIAEARARLEADERTIKLRSGILPPDVPVSTLAASAEAVPPQHMATLTGVVKANSVAHAMAVAAQAPAASVQVSAPAAPAQVDAVAGSMTAAVAAAAGRKCGVCGQVGHNARSCSAKQAEAAPVATAPQAPIVVAPPVAAPPALPAQMTLPAMVPVATALPAMTSVATALPAMTLPAMVPQDIATAPSPVKQAPPGIELYVDCIVSVKAPWSIDVVSLDSYIANKMRELAKAASPGVAQPLDIRVCANENMGFGKWRGALTTAVQYDLPPPGNYSVEFVAQDEVKQVVVAALAPYCMRLVRGIH